jgi:hypothetical protein
MVLTGVSTAEDMIRAAASERPDYLGPDLRSLYARADILRVGPHPAWRIDIGPSAVTVHATGRELGDPLSVVRATASAVWNASLDGSKRPMICWSEHSNRSRRADYQWRGGHVLTPSWCDAAWPAPASRRPN